MVARSKLASPLKSPDGENGRGRHRGRSRRQPLVWKRGWTVERAVAVPGHQPQRRQTIQFAVAVKILEGHSVASACVRFATEPIVVLIAALNVPFPLPSNTLMPIVGLAFGACCHLVAAT